MKNLFFKAALFLAMPLMTVSFASCSDDDDEVNVQKKSELFGQYKPFHVVKDGWDTKQASILVNTTWKDLKDKDGNVTPLRVAKTDLMGDVLDSVTVNKPDSPVLMIDLEGKGEKQPLVWGLVNAMLPNLLDGLCMEGLDNLNLTDGGNIIAGYHEMIVKENGDKEFAKEVSYFPGADFLPNDILSYRTDAHRIYVKINKDALRNVALPETKAAKATLVNIIDGVLKMYKLPITSTKDAYIIPLKYKKNYNKFFFNESMFGSAVVERKAELFVYVDLGMIRPYLPGLKALLTDMGKAIETGAWKTDNAMLKLIIPQVAPMVDEIFGKAKEFELGMCLQKVK